MSRMKEYFTMDHPDDWEFTGWENKDTEIIPPPQRTECQLGNHQFPDTGLLKTWCKNCGVEAEFNRKTGHYICTGKLPEGEKK